MTWKVYPFYPNPSPDVDCVFYMAFHESYPIYKKVNQKTGESSYGFRPDALIWFMSEEQILKFLRL